MCVVPLPNGVCYFEIENYFINTVSIGLEYNEIDQLVKLRL